MRAMLSRALTLAAAAALLLSLAACGSDDDTASDSGASNSSATGSASASAGANEAAGTCSYPSDGTTAAKQVDTPPSTPTESGKVAATMATTIGDLKLTLDADKAPCTVNSFVSLAKQGFFDDTRCHRLTTAASGISVLQCGDPTGTGSGGPGYSFADELNGKEHYGKGVLAMANAGPDTNGSQFFLVYADSSYLDQQPNYTIFGTIDPASVKLIAKAASAGVAGGGSDGAPKTKVEIRKVTVR